MSVEIERGELLAEIRGKLADIAGMSEKADRLLADSTSVVAESQLLDIQERWSVWSGSMSQSCGGWISESQSMRANCGVAYIGNVAEHP